LANTGIFVKELSDWLTSANPEEAVLTPGFSPAVFNNPIRSGLFIDTPADSQHCVIRYLKRIEFILEAGMMVDSALESVKNPEITRKTIQNHQFSNVNGFTNI